MIPYIIHPLSVELYMLQFGCPQDVIIESSGMTFQKRFRIINKRTQHGIRR